MRAIVTALCALAVVAGQTGYLVRATQRTTPRRAPESAAGAELADVHGFPDEDDGSAVRELDVTFGTWLGIEFWGGTVGVKHLVVTGAGDDLIDWDLGWRGKIQFAVVEQGPDAGNNGSECDNNESDHLADPVSNPTLSNVTFLGAPGIAEDNYAMLFRHGAAPRYHNVAAAGFSAGCLAIRDQATFDRFADGDAAITHTVLGCAVPFEDAPDETEQGTEEAVFEAGAGNQVVADLGLAGWAPAAGSPLLGAGQTPDDPWFDAVDFVGGVGPDDWTAGWTVSSTN